MPTKPKTTKKTTKKKAAPKQAKAAPKVTEPLLPKIGRPATQALATIGVTKLDQVARYTEEELQALHGMGPKALGILFAALAAKGKTFRKGPSRSRA